MSNALPKLSYVLLAHNREQYIRAAIESAFAQDYKGELEYIFSDDCSTDGSYAIMQECVANYNGKRKIILTQTAQNGHLALHTNHAISFVSLDSDWIIRADDDDYSSIDRCSLIGKAIADNSGCSYIVTAVKKFDDSMDADILNESMQPAQSVDTSYRIADINTGCDPIKNHNPRDYSYKAWHMDCFRQFGGLHADGYYVDDLCCYFRASILGYGVYIEGATAVFMRTGSNNMCRGGDDNSRGYQSIIRLERFTDKYYNLTFIPLKEDIAAYANYLNERSIEANEFMNQLDEEIQKRIMLASYWRNGTINRLNLRRRMGAKGVFSLLRCLPLPLFALIQACYRKLK